MNVTERIIMRIRKRYFYPSQIVRRYARAILLVIITSGFLSACTSSTKTTSASNTRSAFAGKTLTIIVPNAPGGPMDTYARLTVPYLQKSLGVSAVKVDDVTGAAGVIGINQLASSSPNGLTIGFTDASEILLPALGNSPGVDYNPATLTYLGAISSAPYVLAVGEHSPITSIKALEASHGTFVYPTSGLGPDFYSMAAISATLNFGLKYISGYASLAEATRGVLAGSVSGELLQTSVAAPYINSKEMRPILTVNSSVIKQYSNVPTWMGLVNNNSKYREIAADFTAILTLGRTFYGPPKMAGSISKVIQRAVIAMLANKHFLTAAKKAALPIVYRSSKEEINSVQGMIKDKNLLTPQE